MHGFIQVMGTISCKKHDAFMPLYLSEETGGERGQGRKIKRDEE
jgi:hypothetical protein